MWTNRILWIVCIISFTISLTVTLALIAMLQCLGKSSQAKNFWNDCNENYSVKICLKLNTHHCLCFLATKASKPFWFYGLLIGINGIIDTSLFEFKVHGSLLSDVGTHIHCGVAICRHKLIFYVLFVAVWVMRV